MFEEINKRSLLVEKELLFILFVNPELTPKALARISKQDLYFFSVPYGVITNAHKENKNVINELLLAKIKTSEFVGAVSFRKIEDVCLEIKDLSNKRKLATLLANSVEELSTKNIENIDQYISDFQRKLSLEVSSKGIEQSNIDSVLASYKEQQLFYKEKFKNGNGIIGISTGYQKIDEIIDGFRPEHLWVVGGYSSLGKTSCSLNFVSNLISQGKRVVYYSLEMSKIDIVSRLLGIMTKQSGLSILKGFDHDHQAVERATKLMQESCMGIYNEKTDLASIQSSMVEEHLNSPVDLFVVDFLQLITVKGAKSEYESVSTSILELQQLAKKLKIPIMVLSQISNEGARNTNDMVMSFKGSGSIAAAADLAIEINIGEMDKVDWKKKMHEGQPVNMMWNIRKNRHGRVGTLDMSFNGRTGVFEPSDFEKL